MFSSDRATENPRARCSNNSMDGSYLISQKARPEREHESQPLDEGQPYEKDQEDARCGGNLPAELVAGQAAQEDQEEHGDVYRHDVEHSAGEHHGPDDDAETTEVEFGKLSSE